MPIFYQQQLSDDTMLAVWKIEESEEFFLQKVPLQKEIRHPHKRLQHLAGRYLLQHLFPAFPISLILIADTRKPYLEDDIYHFSISHCDQYAAAIASKSQRVGIDIETVKQKIILISKKFLSAQDQKALQDDEGRKLSALEFTTAATIAWCAKEAIFKWYGKGEVDFREHIHIRSLHQHANSEIHLQMDFSKESPSTDATVSGRLFENLSLCFIATSDHR